MMPPVIYLCDLEAEKVIEFVNQNQTSTPEQVIEHMQIDIDPERLCSEMRLRNYYYIQGIERKGRRVIRHNVCFWVYDPYFDANDNEQPYNLY